MPIPIPVPMPMGPKPAFAHTPIHSHHQEPHMSSHDGDGGDVKKIYILQPMPGIKGSMGGHGRIPHQQMPHSKMYQTHSRPSDSMDYGTNEVTSHSPINHPSSHNKHHESLKILPIVVIPPIAPMTPIQLTPSYHNFANEKGSRLRYRHSGANERKSFADYAGIGDDMFRDSAKKSHRSLMRTVGGMRFRRPMPPSYGQASRLRMSLLDDMSDDYELGPSSWRPNSQSPTDSRGHSSSRARQARYNTESRFNPRISSIQDVLEQPIFDDEPTSGLDEYRGSNQITRHECCAPGYRSGSRYDSQNRRLQSLLDQSSEISNDHKLISRENSNEKDAIEMSGSTSGQDQYRLLNEARTKIPPEIHHSDIEGPLHDLAGDLQYNSALSDREIRAMNAASPLDHDEWKYESMKSVSISNLNETTPHNSTLASSTNANTHNIIDKQPPKLASKA